MFNFKNLTEQIGSTKILLLTTILILSTSSLYAGLSIVSSNKQSSDSEKIETVRLSQTDNDSLEFSLKLQKQKAFETVFGDAVILDPKMVEKVKEAEEGKRHYLDTDGDGQPDEVWFIDTDSRHNDRNRPMLVKVIDENGNLQYGSEPDKYGDLWVADWNADGLVDAVISYEDTDGDGDLDQMGMFFVDQGSRLRVWWFIDDGDDNMLGYDVDYYYYQKQCQVKTHFGGDESLIALYFDPEEKKWIPFWENPFLFYDSDGDGITEEVVRIEGEGDIVRFLRWSLNVNPIEGIPRNFDVGITACAPGWEEDKNRESDFNFKLNDDQIETFRIRGFPTGGVIKRETARETLKSIQWARVLMTWDENDLNSAWNRKGDYIERWEGIISSGVNEPGFFMPQVGGPDCGPYNKRYELLLNPDGPNQFYFNPASHKIHLRECDSAWINVDYNGDWKSDMLYLWRDRDNDGFIDHLEITILDDGEQIKDQYDINCDKIQHLDWEFNDFNRVRMSILKSEPENCYRLIMVLYNLLDKKGFSERDNPLHLFINNRFQGGGYIDELAERMLNSDESILYYLTLLKDRLIATLKKNRIGDNGFWNEFNGARSSGDTEMMREIVKQSFSIDESGVDWNSWITSLRNR